MDTGKPFGGNGCEKRGMPGISVKWRWLMGSVLLVLAMLFQIAARRVLGFGEWYAQTVYPVLVRVIGGFFGIFSFSVVEWGLYALIIWGLWYGIFCIVGDMKTQALDRAADGKDTPRRRIPFYICHRGLVKLCSMIFLILSFLAFSYTVNCGINYYRLPFSFYLDLEVQDSTVEELERLCLFLSEKVADSSGELLKEWGNLLPDDATSRHFPHQAKADMEKLGEQYPQLFFVYPVPKPVAVSEILSIQSLSGIYSPFTIEANYNQDMTAYNIPHTACHELSHLKGFMREDEANFIGYLACVGSESAYSRYSGYLTGFIYANNALFSQQPERAMEIYTSLPQEVLQDLRANNEFWKQYEGKVSEAATKVNDTYLKANSQEKGVKSYGRVVDLLLAYYESSAAE